MKDIKNNTDKPIIISDDSDDVYYCQYCHHRLIPLQKPRGIFECPKCVIRFNPDNDQMKRATMITTIEGDVPVAGQPKEIAVSTTPSNLPNPFDRQPPEIRGGLAELQKKGLKITSYHTTEKT